jgi:hypothetical protein
MAATISIDEDLDDGTFDEVPPLPLVFVFHETPFYEELREDTRRIVRKQGMIFGGLALLFVTGTLDDVAHLARNLLGGTHYWLHIAILVVTAVVLVAWAAIGVSKLLAGGDDHGLEFHRDGIVWVRTPSDRYPIPWSTVGRITRLLGNDTFELVEPIQVLRGPGRWTALDFIPFGQYEANWRFGNIGAVLNCYAPHLYQFPGSHHLVAAPPTDPPRAADRFDDPAPSDHGAEPIARAEDDWEVPWLPLVLRNVDSPGYAEALEGGRTLHRLMRGIGTIAGGLVMAHVLGVIDLRRAPVLVGEIGDLPALLAVAI